MLVNSRWMSKRKRIAQPSTSKLWNGPYADHCVNRKDSFTILTKLCAASVAIPPVTTISPRNGTRQGREEIKYCVGNNHVVVDSNKRWQDHHANSDPCEDKNKYIYSIYDSSIGLERISTSPLKSGLNFQAEVGPKLVNCPRAHSMKKIGNPANNNIMT